MSEIRSEILEIRNVVSEINEKRERKLYPIDIDKVNYINILYYH